LAEVTEPKPKPAPLVAAKSGWPVSSLVEYSPLELDPNTRFASVVSRRRTSRDCIPASLGQILSVVQFVLRACQIGVGPNAGRLRKATISAGALHPVEALVVSGPDVSDPIVYLDEQDIFGTVSFRDADLAQEALRELKGIVSEARGHFVLLVANLAHAQQAYENPHSLLWRDAGAVLQTFSLSASAAGMLFIPLGLSGRRILDAISSPHEGYLAVGTGIIGKAATLPD
jgi:hypothetical protein